MSVNQGGIKYNFWVFGLIWPGIEPRSVGPLAITLAISLATAIKEKQNIKLLTWIRKTYFVKLHNNMFFILCQNNFEYVTSIKKYVWNVVC